MMYSANSSSPSVVSDAAIQSLALCNRPKRRFSARLISAGLAVGAALTLMIGGCTTTGKITPIASTTDFQKQVVQSKGPVLVDFYKDGCPTCVIQESCLEKLSDEYGTQVKFTKFKIREATMISSCPEFMDHYKLFWVPTVILFVDGQEKQRWVFNHGADEFRGALDESVGKPGVQKVASGTEQPVAKQPLVQFPGASDKCVEGQGCPINTGH